LRDYFRFANAKPVSYLHQGFVRSKWNPLSIEPSIRGSLSSIVASMVPLRFIIYYYSIVDYGVIDERSVGKTL
jgi:hypothetical protein